MSAQALDLWDAAGIAAAFTFDKNVEAWAERVAPPNSALANTSRYLTELGGPVGLSLGVAALWHANPVAGEDAAKAVVYAALATYGLKILLGRARPDQAQHGFFGPSLSDGRHAMPSGHTAGSFALASVVSHHYPGFREEAYAVAGTVGTTRVLLDRHWLSDVGAGALLGAAIGNAITQGRLELTWKW